jgi:hypothetical protein
LLLVPVVFLGRRCLWFSGIESVGGGVMRGDVFYLFGLKAFESFFVGVFLFLMLFLFLIGM